MSFGLNNSPTTFMDRMNKVFKLFLNVFVTVFIDNIFIYQRSKAEHAYHLRVVLQTLQDHILYKYPKYEFWLIFVPFHGHVITHEGIRVDIQKIEAIKSCPKPLNPIEVRSFLVLAEY